VKTLIPLRSVAFLDGLEPDFARMEALCERIGSTGLYPYATADATARIFDARQFPKASGYPEDAATGIAAAALLFGLLENGQARVSEEPITVRQGRAMGRPSAITVRFRHDESGKMIGCWLSGHVTMEPT
jgi:PhzF family phenazine biosynthesis protein